jgi:hypothetical protein
MGDGVMKLIYVVLFLTILSGCDGGPKSGRGFTLPDGDLDRGRAVFVELQCNTCHSVGDVKKLPTLKGDSSISVMLGGKVSSIQTYGQLVTSIVNPSHRLAGRYAAEQVSTADGVSLMRNYNDVMTVDQLIDLVAYLQSNYELQVYQRSLYKVY